jgi:hypothetical protein
MEVEYQTASVAVREARGFEVAPEHLGARLWR